MNKRPPTEYRVVLYEDVGGPPRYVYPERPAEDNVDAMVEVLEHHVYSGYATGGHIEELMPLAGKESDYVVCLRAEEVWR